MMETFLVLGLCFILYEALDFFQGCIHSNTPSPSDQIEAYRRELDEQRQQQQQEQFLAGLTPLLGAQFAAAAAAAAAGSQSTLSSTPTASTASVISDSYEQEQSQSQSQSHSQSHSQSQSQSQQPHSLSTPGLFRPAALGYYDPEDPLHATSSLPRDYYYLQQQQLKNKASSKSLLSKFSATNSDNRIHPEGSAHGVLGAHGSPHTVVTTQPLPAGESAASLGLFDCQPQLLPLLPAAPLFLELKRAIISTQAATTATTRRTSRRRCHIDVNEQAEQEQEQEPAESESESEEEQEQDTEEDDEQETICPQCVEEETQQQQQQQQHQYDEAELPQQVLDQDPLSSHASDCHAGGANSEPNICAASQLPRIHHIAIDDIGIGGIGLTATSGEPNHCLATSSSSSSHADFREIECERLRRKCVSVKRIYSISEKF
ncbi:hypothetical protein AWZ03_013944 [Drosophila navojoa]|uniref:Uncharacterized protein n=1 Tax=Drosophila navojoa TaxID=7232 RepID=A0A484AVP2_DRONA|nr:histone H3.v1 [Drosophila navojoa]TDG39635.1 hypothetical protein AWZ03_013944 [Drosophila navojoa]